MTVRELWSDRDQRDLETFESAVESRDLLGALFAIEGTGPGSALADRILLESWALHAAAISTAGSGNAVAQAEALRRVLGRDLGFCGDTRDYYNPANSLLHQVLERRRGMPILLSIVWMEVGRRARFAIEGIGMPGHFLVRIGGGQGVLSDPFSAGALLSAEDCRRALHELSGGTIAWRDEFLSPSSEDQILERVLQNLAGSYKRAADEAGRYRAATFLAALRPDSPDRLLERAEIADELGLWDEAAETYVQLVERFPETSEALEAAERLGGEQPPTLN